jgi:ubiquinone/menaquinone biosynthesis C-methylase UbiE
MRNRRSASLRAGVVAVLAAACVTSIGLAQTGVHPVTGRQYAQTMSVDGAPWLERREREREEDPDLGLRLLKVAKGSTVGDVGAGSGFMSLRLARLVGPQGRVYAVDVQPGMLQLLQQNAAKAKVANVVPVLGGIDDPKLPAGELDLIIMVDVYHEFSQPQRMLQRMHEALKPGGRLALFEYRAEDPDVPILPLHKMTKKQVKTEVELEGFKQTRVFDDLPWQHLIVFTRP